MNAEVELIGSPLDIEGVCGDDLEFAVFFGYLPITGFTFTAFIELRSPPFKKTWPLIVTVLDATNGLINITLARADTDKIGPISGRPWKMTWTEVGKVRTIEMGKFALNRL
jgi:hypothetical protein